MKKIRFVVAVLAFLTAPTAFGGENAVENPLNAGAWAKYRLTTSARQLYFSLSGNERASADAAPTTDAQEVFDCRLTVRKNEGGKLQLDFEVARDGVMLGNVTLNDYLLKNLLPPSRNLAGLPVKKEFPAHADNAAREIEATRVNLTGAGKRLELTRSPAVPFGVVALTCGEFSLELTDFHW
ncbi:hypothetical protein FACS1894139_03950 [Planctomycetales bacterium]|nr:hypothetical protein FACS1894108_03760 [Planctomycetales bacterium]GHT03513.1 hypothetical protein FACS1894139_03950 [Planctomycetales bacterium]